MSEDRKLISKKDLLQRYGISYGALYRWKRMGLIPEEWFIKQSTQTGQETFFDEEVICERINMIIAAKDGISLEELSKKLKPHPKEELTLTVETVYGTWNFRASDIRRILVNNALEITEKIVRVLQEEQNKWN